ncbi:class A beta-lactamase [Gracilibacillus sp. HCP3S3_G5_1]|uniref:class A beta-lactamase n=1 Tax=unclassified Gracilibacillus TaxID=2625209 RepID=UPI003F88C8DC
MKKVAKTIWNIQLLAVVIAVFSIITLTACMDTDRSTDTPLDEEKETEETSTEEQFSQLEKEFDAHLGVYAIDTNTEETIEYKSDDRFAFTSTYKALAAAVILQQNSLDALDEVITYSEDDLVTYSPVTEDHVESGMTLEELIEAAVRFSDNTAGNLLYEKIGGPEEFEMALREIGDNVTNANRYETDLNNFTPDDNRDTSTPKALATTLKAFLVEDLLSDEELALFTDWLKGNATGDSLIRAGAPVDWEVGDKSGAGSYGTRNDIAVVWPPDREPIIMAIMSRHDQEDAEYDDALIAKAAEVTFNALK